ncbi:pseudouridine synthase [Hymenobacter taeanensis]|uniref:Pseudouridine synthase n=1 Tax=Hymenobacter taeanensis TaxID=2735321 RepID=A0A6M6BEP1_9BACT|nr:MULTISPECIES: pseudouridine synthase [Hymenobacter]QJX46412.1 pseudouridine synthase [Hymenobacter taeanensis]UOQ80273.1 pseudouridine synthase [Hymenobacter sp. 5414T-23]
MSHQHFLLFKPYGYLSQFVSENAREARKKKFLGELHNFPEGTMAIGRLDEESEGLLLLTTDGRVSERVRRKDVEKEYYAQVDGLLTDEAVTLLQQGIEIAHRSVLYQTLPARVRRLEQVPELPPRGRKIRDDRHGPTSWVSIIVTEGKFRQIRKMTAAAGFPTLRLVRVRVGGTWLGSLAPGEVREVTEFELGVDG